MRSEFPSAEGLSPIQPGQSRAVNVVGMDIDGILADVLAHVPAGDSEVRPHGVHNICCFY